MEFLIQLQQLECRAAAIAKLLGFGDIRIVQLPFEPLRRRVTALGARLDLDGKVAAGWGCAFFQAALFSLAWDCTTP